MTQVAFSAAPLDNFTVVRASMNGVKLRPLPGKTFTAGEIQQLKQWMAENGWTAFLEKNYVRAVGSAPGASWEDVPQPVRVTRKGLAAATKQAERDQATAQRTAKQDADLLRLPAVAWIRETFGADAMGDFNLCALARYLDGEARTFEGLASHKWSVGLIKVGFSEEDLRHLPMADVLARVADAYRNPAPAAKAA